MNTIHTIVKHLIDEYPNAPEFDKVNENFPSNEIYKLCEKRKK